MNIIFVIATNTAGGAERVISVLANEMAESNRISIVNFDESSCFYSIDSRVNIIKLGLVNKRVMARNILVKLNNTINELVSIIKKEKPDIVIPFLFNAELPTYVACAKTRTPCITSVRNSAGVYPLYQRMIRKFVFKRIAGVVFQSSAVKSNRDFAKVKKATVIMNPLAYEVAKETPSSIKNKIISVGRLSEQKNHEMTIRAIAEVVKEFPDVHLHIYGEGPLRENLKQLISVLHMDKNIYLEGAVTNAIIKNQDAEMFIMSSKYEGFPNALVEAMACGIPVICTDFDSGVARELIGKNEKGMLVPVDDTKALERAVVFNLENSKVATDKANQALKVCESLSPSLISREWICFIQDCIKRND